MTSDARYQLLRKRYVAAQIKSSTPAPGELATIVRTRSEVLETIGRWLHDGGGAQDALDDLQLYSAMRSFFRHPTDHLPPATANADDPSIQHGFSLVRDNLKGVISAFTAQTFRPIMRVVPALEAATDSTSALAPTFSADPPNVDQLDPAELVSNLDAMALCNLNERAAEFASIHAHHSVAKKLFKHRRNTRL